MTSQETKTKTDVLSALKAFFANYTDAACNLVLFENGSFVTVGPKKTKEEATKIMKGYYYVPGTPTADFNSTQLIIPSGDSVWITTFPMFKIMVMTVGQKPDTSSVLVGLAAREQALKDAKDVKVLATVALPLKSL